MSRKSAFQDSHVLHIKDAHFRMQYALGVVRKTLFSNIKVVRSNYGGLGVFRDVLKNSSQNFDI